MIKHIKIPKAIAEAWLKDLRSNPKQGRFYLQDSKGGYCCLGRLQVVVDGDVERDWEGRSLIVPSLEWLKKHNIVFLDKYGGSYESPYCNKIGYSFTTLSGEGVSFPEIADLLEAEIEYND